MKIKIIQHGPYQVSGNIPLKLGYNHKANSIYEWVETKQLSTEATYYLCRCGQTKAAPFCSGEHKHIQFDGIETAEMTAYQKRAKKISGPTLDLLDDQRCAYARYCHRQHGSVWRLTKTSDIPEHQQEVIEGSTLCPAGRITAFDKSGTPYEQHVEEQIRVCEDPSKNVSAHLATCGNIELESAEGVLYENRPRRALCRCGASKGKPFCDAAHSSIKFKI